MSKIIIYTASSCPFCRRAKDLLSRHELPYEEIDVSADAVVRQEMVKITGRRSVPQIVIEGNPIGGYQELQALADQGGLAKLIAGSSE